MTAEEIEILIFDNAVRSQQQRVERAKRAAIRELDEFEEEKAELAEMLLQLAAMREKYLRGAV